MATAFPEVGAKAPAFSAQDQHEQTVSLADQKGKWTVLYFYPRDNTPGCTKEACSFRDRNPEIAALGATILGVSTDSTKSHAKFRDAYELPFSLLADTDHKIADAYGAWGLKKNYGREYEGMFRSTVIIDPAGTVAKVWKSVKPADHGDQVLEWLKANTSSS
jgi:peroxiredoxin Q/BCP